MSNKQNYELFPTLLTKYSDILNDKQCKDIYNYCLKKDQKDYELLFGPGKSSYSLQSNIINDIGKEVLSCNKFDIFIQNLINQYTSEINLSNITVQNSWFNIQNEDSILMQHYHPMSVLSAAIYVNVDENSSKIYFENPNNIVRHLNSYRGEAQNYNRFNDEFFWFNVKQGDIIIFPSHIKHGSLYTQNKTKNRLVISLNAI